MTKFFFIAILFISTNTFSQKLDGFLGIKFGSSIAEVKKEMLARKGCTIDLTKCDTSHLFFGDCVFAGRETLFILFRFFKNKFHTVNVFFRPAFEQKVNDLYLEIKKELDEKYYLTKSDFNESFVSFWKFKNTKTTRKDVNNSISLDITELSIVKLTYQDGLLVLPALAAQNVKNKSDY